MNLHREGKTTIIATSIFVILLSATVWRFSNSNLILWIAIAFSATLLILILQFFRNPKRVIPNINLNELLSPADGKVVVIEDCIEKEYFEDERLMISIFMSPINVHSNHHPASGEIVYSKYHPGKYLVAWHPKSSTENERHTVVYNVNGTEVLVRQIAGALARRIVNYTSPGDKVKIGEEMGFIKFGSRVDVFLPVGTNYKVQIGQNVKSRTDIIAVL